MTDFGDIGADLDENEVYLMEARGRIASEKILIVESEEEDDDDNSTYLSGQEDEVDSDQQDSTVSFSS